MTRQRVIIEDWLPIRELSVESQRERGAASALPPIYFLHVWWARRPLIASRAAVLGSVLPAWSDEWPDELTELFPAECEYRNWFVHLLGIHGDPVAARAKVRAAIEQGTRIPNPYEGPRAFTVGPDAEQISVLRSLLTYHWGTERPMVLDPTAGGGSIPFESIRYGLPTIANELNPVASFILEATLSLPARFGTRLAEDIAEWGKIWASRVEERLKPFFPHQPGESIRTYLFARTVACPETGKLVPLSPNWWLKRGNNPVAVKLIADPSKEEVLFEVVSGDGINFDPSRGTVHRGKGRSPWTGNTISGDYIKGQAQAGLMGTQLYAIAIRRRNESEFRQPNRLDLSAIHAAASSVIGQYENWLDSGLVPNEYVPTGAKTSEPLRYGISNWNQFFSPRQLLSLAITNEELCKLRTELYDNLREPRAMAIESYLAIAFSKVTNYNATFASWHAPWSRARSVFDRHDFSLKWSFIEPYGILPWAIEQAQRAYRSIVELLEPPLELLTDADIQLADLMEIQHSDAADLLIQDKTLYTVVVDPPYYDNVQYAELSDFFYVWLKRTVGHIYPERFSSELTDKSAEAVANPSRFVEFDRKNAKQLARQDYEAKMTNIFAEAHRVLRDDGVLTVMFNHKKVEAWDALGRSLIEGGFEILTSWPVHTESEHSLHQAKKAAAASTILLTCRKRSAGFDSAWWDDDLKSTVRRVARDKAGEYAAAGIQGVDLYIATFGPVLSIISRQWPVLTSEVDSDTGEPLRLRPEDALDLARQEVADLRLRGLALGRPVEFDPVTDWYLLAWDAFPAVEFPYDEARKLAFAVGIDVESDLRRIGMVAKKGGSVVLQEPKVRRVKYADPEADTFERLIDGAHALMNAWREDGIVGAEAFLKRSRFEADTRFRSLLQALLNVIPRTKKRSKFIRPEAEALDAVAVLFPDLRIPEDSRPLSQPVQGSLDWSAKGG